MKNSEELRQQLRSINRKSYPAYKGLKGLYHLELYSVHRPCAGRSFASPSHVSIQISHRDAGFPSNIIKIHLPGLLLRLSYTSVEKQVSQYSFVQRLRQKRPAHCQSLWSGDSSRTACEITEKGITARFLWASLLMAARSMPLNWRKSF